ncbi:hypothetical protein [Nocardia flavorosea]|uniref:Uncharacterized protein n=1 Tax=Nocardia flavorosea TaxID=53429 RepID=A0A846YF14_9NOCA|nr:hypothetical protein [Nocardia flavorosea]NKY57295.1 hypothetical protein [Nocardia flavorosea]
MRYEASLEGIRAWPVRRLRAKERGGGDLPPHRHPNGKRWGTVAYPAGACPARGEPPDPARELAGGLTQRPSDVPLQRLATDLEPYPVADGWFNPIAGALPAGQTNEWRRMHRGLDRVTRLTVLTDLAELQRWLPLVRRFSYVLPPPGGWPGRRRVTSST